ncbi:MAG: hypothetical protein ACOC7U_07060 [Spirochaetota bacterium]
MKKIFQNLSRVSRGLTKIKKEDIEKIFNELQERGVTEEKDREPFINKTLEKFDQKGKNTAKKLKQTVNEMFTTNKVKIEQINKRIDEIAKDLKKLKTEKEKVEKSESTSSSTGKKTTQEK